MKQVVFAVTECNPFHNGHRAFFDEIRRRFPERGIVCIQSGSFVQRGEFAVADKYARGEEAVRGGADLVLELIPPYCALSGEAFAAAAVHVASGIGLEGILAFGSEVPETEDLQIISRRLAERSFEEALRTRLEKAPGEGYPAARAALYEERYGACPALSLPNASLGLSSLAAIEREERKMDAVALPRKEGETFTSATRIRALLREGKAGVAARFLPVYELGRLFENRAPVKAFPPEETLLYLLNALSREEIASCYGMAPLADRAKELARSARSFREIYEGLKAAHLTDSRIRRSLLALLLRTPRGMEETLPPYAAVLAANETGRAILASARGADGGVRLVTKPADALRDPALAEAANRAAFADSLYAMAQGLPGNHFLRQSPRML